MLKGLTLVAVVTLALPMTSARGDDPKPPGNKPEQGIKAEVRGALRIESGRGYYIVVKSGPKGEWESRVWLPVKEDKVRVQRLEGLIGKEVVARGKLEQMPEDGRFGVPSHGMYLRQFEFEAAGAP